MVNPQQFTQKSQEILQIASQLAMENGQPQVEPPHIFLALLQDEENIVVSVLHKLKASLPAILSDAQALVTQLPKQFGANNMPGNGQIMLSPAAMHVLQSAFNESKKMGDEYVSIEHLFLAFFATKNPISEILVRNHKINNEETLKALASIRGTQKVDSPNPEAKYNALEKYGKNLTELARKEKN